MNSPVDLTGVLLRTPRLVLRPFEPGDLQDFYDYARVDGVGQMAGWMPHRDMEESRMILNMFIEGKNQFAIVRDGRVIGSVGIEEYDEAHLPELEALCAREIGYVLAKDQWGQGLMTEAVHRVIEYLFEEAGLEAIVCGAFLRNSRSQRVQEKCGFRFVREVDYTTRCGTIERAAMSVLRRADWLRERDRV